MLLPQFITKEGLVPNWLRGARKTKDPVCIFHSQCVVGFSDFSAFFPIKPGHLLKCIGLPLKSELPTTGYHHWIGNGDSCRMLSAANWKPTAYPIYGCVSTPEAGRFPQTAHLHVVPNHTFVFLRSLQSFKFLESMTFPLLPLVILFSPYKTHDRELRK